MIVKFLGIIEELLNAVLHLLAVLVKSLLLWVCSNLLLQSNSVLQVILCSFHVKPLIVHPLDRFHLLLKVLFVQSDRFFLKFLKQGLLTFMESTFILLEILSMSYLHVS